MPTKQAAEGQVIEEFPGNNAFAPALLDPDLEVPAGMVGPDGNTAPKRFSVYRNNVVSSLMEALAETYPSIKALVGEENFATICRIYISAHPPSSPMMQAYGDLLPQFLRDFQPLKHSPFLVDVADVEKHWIAAYHSADATPFDGTLLANIEPDLLMETRFDVHPATQLISSNYALFDLFQTRNNQSGSISDFSTHQFAQSVLITRPYLSVEVTRLDPAQTLFFTELIANRTLGHSVEAAMQHSDEFDASAAIALMLTTGAFTNISNNN